MITYDVYSRLIDRRCSVGHVAKAGKRQKGKGKREKKGP